VAVGESNIVLKPKYLILKMLIINIKALVIGSVIHGQVAKPVKSVFIFLLAQALGSLSTSFLRR
jgi:hypothetical protein